jgi:hypothetical protein
MSDTTIDFTPKAAQVLSEFTPYARHVRGEAARQEFEECLEGAYAEGATGGVFGYAWGVVGTLPGAQEVTPLLTRIRSRAELNLSTFNMIIVDSGSIDGDSWKYVYHPAIQSGTFIQEA